MADAVTYYLFVRDHSGSMNEFTSDGKVKKSELAMTNFNEQLAKIKKDNDDEMENIITVIEFDDEIYCNIENVPVNEVRALTSYWTGGMTSLNDSIANGVNRIKIDLNNDPRTNKAAMVIIQTDGYENNSSDYKGPDGTRKIQAMITDLENNEDWTFTFLGDNLDPKVVSDLGIKMGNTMIHKSDSDNVLYAYAAQNTGMDNYMTMRKAGGTKTASFFNNDNDTFNEGNQSGDNS